MGPDFSENIKRAIAEGALDVALGHLRTLGESLPVAAQEDILLLESRLKQLKQKEIRGVIDSEKATLELNKIKEQTLTLVQEYGKSPEERARLALRKKLRWIIPLAVYLLLALGIIYWLLQPQSGFRIEADLQVERLTFKYLDGAFDLAEGKVYAAAIQNYEKVQIEGNRLSIKLKDGKWQNASLSQGEFFIEANEAIPGVGLQLGALQLERISTAPEALLTFSQPDLESSIVDLTIQQPLPLTTEWIYQDSLELLIEHATLNYSDETVPILQPTPLCVYPPKNRAREVRVNSFPGTSHLNLSFEAGFVIGGKSLSITSPTFYQPIESVAVPTILSGGIQIGQLDEMPLKSIDLYEGEALDIYTDQPLDLKQMQFTENGIHLAFEGEVQRIETGRNHQSRNPTQLEWLWHSQKLLIIIMGLLILGLGAFILRIRGSKRLNKFNT